MAVPLLGTPVRLLALVIDTILITGVAVTLMYVLYNLFAIPFSLAYSTKSTDEPARNVKIVITTLASESVRNALYNTIEKTTEMFDDYEIFCLIDEGADLQEELKNRSDLETVIVPDEYQCRAEAKGRAINYFIETEVARENWYAFIDDDNVILDRKFLHEIPYYEPRGYRVMNPVLLPRQGESVLTYIADHIRLVDDLTIFRFFTGVMEEPYMGLHGELLCAKGDILQDITFDRKSIVEDFAFAMEVTRSDWKSWQSETRVSILSPHDILSFFKQRRRWFVGIATYLPKSPFITRAFIGPRVLLWGVAITGSWMLLPLWLVGIGPGLPLAIIALVMFGVLLYIGTGMIGIVRLVLDGGATELPRAVLSIFLIPVASLIEHLSPIYSVLRRDTSFVVIRK